MTIPKNYHKSSSPDLPLNLTFSGANPLPSPSLLEEAVLLTAPPPLFLQINSGRVTLNSPAVRLATPPTRQVSKKTDASRSKPRFTMVHFWNTSCGPCKAELAEVIKWANFLKQNKIKVVFIAIEAPENFDDAKKIFSVKGGNIQDLKIEDTNKVSLPAYPKTNIYVGEWKKGQSALGSVTGTLAPSTYNAMNELMKIQ